MMDIRFRSATVRADVEPAACARRCPRHRLQRCSDRVEHVEVILGDAGGRRSRQVRHCIVRVKRHGAPLATVVVVDADVDRAIGRPRRVTQEPGRLSTSPQTTPTRALAA